MTGQANGQAVITASAEGKTRKAMTFASSVKAGLVTMTLTNSDTVPRSAQLLTAMLAFLLFVPKR